MLLMNSVLRILPLSFLMLSLFPLTHLPCAQVSGQEVQVQEDPSFNLIEHPPTATRQGMYTFKSSDSGHLLFESFELTVRSTLLEFTFWGLTFSAHPLTELSDYFTLAIYLNVDGKPAGYPGMEPERHLVKISVPTLSDQLDIQSAEEPGDYVLFLDTSSLSLTLEPGIYWFTAYFDNRFFEYSWLWRFGNRRLRSAYSFDYTGVFSGGEGIVAGQFNSAIHRNYAFAIRGIVHN